MQIKSKYTVEMVDTTWHLLRDIFVQKNIWRKIRDKTQERSV